MKQHRIGLGSIAGKSLLLLGVLFAGSFFVSSPADANMVPAIFPVMTPGYVCPAHPCAIQGSMAVVQWPYTLVEPLPPVAPAPSDTLYQAFYHPVYGPFFQDEPMSGHPTAHRILSMDDVARLGYTKALLSLHRKGREYYLARNYGSAFRVFERAYLSMPNDFLAAYWAAMSALANRNERLAKDWLGITLRVRPDFAPAWDVRYRMGW